MAARFAEWEKDQLSEPPAPAEGASRPWGSLIGPGLLMVGANIGGREWLFGPLVTAQFGGRILWLATVSIIVQVAYNLSVMRYTLYTGETIFVGFFRIFALGSGRDFGRFSSAVHPYGGHRGSQICSTGA